MAGLVPAIHALAAAPKAWRRGSIPRMTVITASAARSAVRIAHKAAMSLLSRGAGAP